MVLSDGAKRLTEWTTCGGCAAKWGADGLQGLVASLAPPSAPDGLLVGLAPFDDAAVLQLTDEVALVSTTDFFPPMVDDPEEFGSIAAANACSDVFAMGGQVRLAVNVAAFPEELPVPTIEAIFRGAADTVARAGGVVAGGHTIRSEEIIFGLAVQGTVHPGRIWTKAGARAGDALVLSKPLGVGIVLQGGAESERQKAVDWMRRLNRDAAERLGEVDGGAGPHACTDVTGYGLAGHASEMARGSSVDICLDAGALPLLPGAEAQAAQGTRTGGDARNRAALRGQVHVAVGVSDAIDAVVHDPQTSGGLLAAVPPDDARALADEGWWVIGEVRDGDGLVRLA